MLVALLFELSPETILFREFPRGLIMTLVIHLMDDLTGVEGADGRKTPFFSQNARDFEVYDGQLERCFVQK